MGRAAHFDLPPGIGELPLNGEEEHIEVDFSADADRRVQSSRGAFCSIVGSDTAATDTPTAPFDCCPRPDVFVDQTVSQFVKSFFSFVDT